MVLQGFAWFLAALALTDSPALFTLSQLTGGLWGGVFLQLVMTFPSGRITSRADRIIVWSGYLLFTVGALPGLLFAGPHELGCDECPDNLLQVSHQPGVANALFAVESALYVVLFAVVLVRRRVVGRVRRHRTAAVRVPRGPAAQPRRDLHDGAQARFVALAMLLNHTRGRAEAAPDEVPALLDEAVEELKTGLAELRELARGIHPAVLTEQGLDVAIETLAARTPVPLTVDSEIGERLPEPIEAAAYFAVSEALANVVRYSQATQASVAVRRSNGRVTVEIADDGIGGADPVHGSGLTGLADRVAALDGTLSLDSPPGGGTRLHIELPV